MPPRNSPRVIIQTAPDPSRQPPTGAASGCHRGGARSLTTGIVALLAQRKSRCTLSVPEKPATGRVPAQPKRVPHKARLPVECRVGQWRLESDLPANRAGAGPGACLSGLHRALA